MEESKPVAILTTGGNETVRHVTRFHLTQNPGMVRLGGFALNDDASTVPRR
jgi:hypothetical protein